MSDFDWKKALPFIASLATGGVPALVTTAAAAIADALGTEVAPTEEGVDIALKSATPEQMAALKKIDADLKVRLRELDIEDKRIDAGKEGAYIDDVKDARKFNANTHGILYLGYGINVLSYACVFAILYGCFEIVSGPAMREVDPGMAAMVGSVVGAVVQWLMSNAAQANGFFFGSSPGSRQAVTDLARSVTEVSGKLK